MCATRLLLYLLLGALYVMSHEDGLWDSCSKVNESLIFTLVDARAGAGSRRKETLRCGPALHWFKHVRVYIMAFNFTYGSEEKCSIVACIVTHHLVPSPVGV